MSAENSDLTSIDKYVTNSVEFKAHVPYMGLEDTRLTVQQEKLVMLICSGMTIAAAGRGAGVLQQRHSVQRGEATAGKNSR